MEPLAAVTLMQSEQAAVLDSRLLHYKIPIYSLYTLRRLAKLLADKKKKVDK